MQYVKIILTLVSLFLVVGAINGQDTKAPKIFIKEQTWDFGTIKQNSKVEHIFKVQNKGNADLIIERTRTTCGCTAAITSEKRIAPGNTGEIKVAFSSGRRTGRQVKHVYVQSNDPDEPALKLTITAEVETNPSPKIFVSPNNIDFGIMLFGKEYKETLMVKNTGKLDLVINEIKGQGSSGHVRANVSSNKIIPAGATNEIEISYEPYIVYESNETIKDIQDYVIIKSNDPYRPELRVLIKGYITNDPWLPILYSNRYF